MTQIKHWGRRYNAAEENICSEPGCYNGGMDFERGQVKCSRHLGLRLEVRNERQLAESRAPRLR